ncbi:MAG: alpha/beta hydrolase [Agathobacter sp.]|nr:alpha/beta hydrolase [Agathobacter sp.]MBQ6812981.1 alpha/beta hydrolase [Agathobacter sp.]
MKQEIIKLNEERNVTLTSYIQEVGGEYQFSKRPAMLILPGGGYAMCSDREADAVAFAYMKAGYQAFILRYSTGVHKAWPNPLEDYEQAMELIENRAEEWGIDATRIAAVGFSAGGHLCACAATLAEHKPAVAILIYPAILKDICDMCQPGLPQPNEHVTEDTCPCFLVAARDDRTVDVKNSLMMQLALAEHDVPFESRIYSYGGHGFSTAEDWIINNGLSSRVPNWVEDSIGWLKENLGTLTMKGFSEPNIAVSKNGDTAPVLSVACSLNHIRKQSEEVIEILKPMFDGIKAVADARGYSLEGLMAAVGANTVRELMEMVMIDEEIILEIDKALHSKVNQI